MKNGLLISVMALVACSSPQQGAVRTPNGGAGKSSTGVDAGPKKDATVARCTSTTCGDHAKCDDTGGKPHCNCETGYEFDKDSTTSCVDIDECAKNNGGCGDGASCTNNPGSFECACEAGVTCPKNSTCVKDKDTKAYHCGCAAPFVGDDPAKCHCDLSGYWAMRQDISVCWNERSVNGIRFISPGVAQVSGWELDKYTYDGTTLKVESLGCGEDVDPDLISPYFGTLGGKQGETYSSYVPDKTYLTIGFVPGKDIPAPGIVPGTMFSTPESAGVAGINLGPDKEGAPWPSDYTKVNPPGGAPPAWEDTDKDGVPGFTLWPKVPGQMTNPCVGSCPAHYSYLPANTMMSGGTNIVSERAACVSVGTRAISKLNVNVNACDKMSGEAFNLKAEGRVHSCTLVPMNKWNVDVTCNPDDWKSMDKCSADDVMQLDMQDQSVNSKATFDLVKLGSLSDTAPDCAAVRAALPAIQRSGPLSKCPF